MNLDVAGIVAGVASHAAASGYFEQVNTYQARAYTGKGIRGTVWCQHITPVPRRSGLAATACRVTLIMRMMQATIMEPYDMIDVDMMNAVSYLIGQYSGDFELGGLITQLDLLGAYGEALEVIAGYLEIDGGMIRIFDLSVPLIVDDVWTQTA
jgi:hypothetical protein